MGKDEDFMNQELIRLVMKVGEWKVRLWCELSGGGREGWSVLWRLCEYGRGYLLNTKGTDRKLR